MSVTPAPIAARMVAMLSAVAGLIGLVETMHGNIARRRGPFKIAETTQRSATGHGCSTSIPFAQTCLGCNGGLGPTSLPLFQGLRELAGAFVF